MSVPRARVLEVIGHTLQCLGFVDDAEVRDESEGLLGRGLGIDSVEALQLIAAFEERFDLTIDDEVLEPELFETIGSLADFFEGRLEP